MPVNGLVTRGWLAVFGAGPHGALGGRRETARNNVWSDWEVIGPPISGAPAAYHNPDGRIEVFAVAVDERLGHVWETEDGEGWSEWESLGAPIAGDPVVFHNSDGHLELFA